MQKLTLIDHLIDELQHGLSTCHTRPVSAERQYPAAALEITDLSDRDVAEVAGLMRVNNAGEVAAQGLYRGQALTARDAATNAAMLQASAEENDHLNWCQQRLSELGQSRSVFDGVWYWGSFGIGSLAGLAGDKWSLGFVKETELQVCAHLDRHLAQLPAEDNRSRAILQTMRDDEAEHAENASAAGAADLPAPVKQAMALVGKLMTFTAYRL